MILVISTSSPVASLAVFGEEGKLEWSFHQEAPRAAGKACMEMLEQWGRLEEVNRIVADIGPGSFTGVRVGVTLAKTLAWVRGLEVAGISAFDLIPGEQVVILARKREWLIRIGGEVKLVTEIPGEAVGYGTGIDDPHYPLAKSARVVGLTWMAAEFLLPEYLLEPSISIPKVPYLPGATSA